MKLLTDFGRTLTKLREQSEDNSSIALRLMTIAIAMDMRRETNFLKIIAICLDLNEGREQRACVTQALDEAAQAIMTNALRVLGKEKFDLLQMALTTPVDQQRVAVG